MSCRIATLWRPRPDVPARPFPSDQVGQKRPPSSHWGWSQVAQHRSRLGSPCGKHMGLNRWAGMSTPSWIHKGKSGTGEGTERKAQKTGQELAPQARPPRRGALRQPGWRDGADKGGHLCIIAAWAGGRPPQ